LQMDKEIEEMKSTHELEDNKPLKIEINPALHVKIDEKNCKIYETNDEPTLDDEVEDPLI
uniref:Reverse transcriptase domain-containing protein n=1 Tax=Gongylonema pulchrum TaxID=637853 RepID=A0A183EFV0_9BILA